MILMLTRENDTVTSTFDPFEDNCVWVEMCVGGKFIPNIFTVISFTDFEHSLKVCLDTVISILIDNYKVTIFENQILVFKIQ